MTTKQPNKAQRFRKRRPHGTGHVFERNGAVHVKFRPIPGRPPVQRKICRIGELTDTAIERKRSEIEGNYKPPADGSKPTVTQTANRYVAKKSSNIQKLADLKGKTVVSTAGTTNIKWLTEENGKQNLGLSILSAKDHAEAFLMVETGRAVAFFMDDILLYGLVANSKAPADYMVGSEAYSVEPYGAMMPRDDAGFRKVVDTATANLYKSGEMAALYDKWFLKPVPPKGITMNVPMSPQLKKVLANPTSSGDPAVYQ